MSTIEFPRGGFDAHSYLNLIILHTLNYLLDPRSRHPGPYNVNNLPHIYYQGYVTFSAAWKCIINTQTSPGQPVNFTSSKNANKIPVT